MSITPQTKPSKKAAFLAEMAPFLDSTGRYYRIFLLYAALYPDASEEERERALAKIWDTLKNQPPVLIWAMIHNFGRPIVKKAMRR